MYPKIFLQRNRDHTERCWLHAELFGTGKRRSERRRIVKKLHVSTARIAALLKRMEQNGLITRHASQEDARRIVVEITPAGIALVDELREQALQKTELLLDQISSEDLETYIRISHKIKAVMNE